MSFETIGFFYDNSGVETAKILSFKETKKYTLPLSCECRVAPQRYKLVKKYLKKRAKLTALIISVKRWNERDFGGIFIRFKYNKLVLLDSQQKFLGTRIYGKICRELVFNEKKAIAYRRIILAAAGYI